MPQEINGKLFEIKEGVVTTCVEKCQIKDGNHPDVYECKIIQGETIFINLTVHQHRKCLHITNLKHCGETELGHLYSITHVPMCTNVKIMGLHSYDKELDELWGLAKGHREIFDFERAEHFMHIEMTYDDEKILGATIPIHQKLSNKPIIAKAFLEKEQKDEKLFHGSIVKPVTITFYIEPNALSAEEFQKISIKSQII